VIAVAFRFHAEFIATLIPRKDALGKENIRTIVDAACETTGSNVGARSRKSEEDANAMNDVIFWDYEQQTSVLGRDIALTKEPLPPCDDYFD
jgi:hypothetical protein